VYGSASPARVKMALLLYAYLAREKIEYDLAMDSRNLESMDPDTTFNISVHSRIWSLASQQINKINHAADNSPANRDLRAVDNVTLLDSLALYLQVVHVSIDMSGFRWDGTFGFEHVGGNLLSMILVGGVDCLSWFKRKSVSVQACPRFGIVVFVKGASDRLGRRKRWVE
jgi:hypothetical protein